ncbi:hypothetical protein SDRG_03758 [Saprolegnia diclina VS20]|uniref:Uncharacterized protein n=1 Tax=Saprolegnia diclina (strain VS20) TaxID=1156394 RepID=T0QL51_SAPDV|nr:hypothetical protein SDRG_03758 [Saprolegnia diclina VS20]EQC38799.1 hypothetical protein SDRG_03758 [Saprolegnia diclina VS20]|eukprot:XP_008607623.1 hypothetical protein SDRG_03758 [Saprolegnia diclina VS20]
MAAPYAIGAAFVAVFTVSSFHTALAQSTSNEGQDGIDPSGFHPWTMYDELTAPYRDKQRASASEGSRKPAGHTKPAEHMGPVAATLDLLADCLEVYLTEIDGPTRPPQFVRASLVILDYCIDVFPPSDAAIVGRLTTTLLDASDAHERAFRCIVQWCDETCAFLQGFLDLRESHKPNDGQVLVSAVFTEGRTILTDAVASIATTGSLLTAARRDLNRLLPASVASSGVQRLECLEPTDAEDYEVINNEEGPQYHLRCLDKRMEDVIELLKMGMSTLASKKVHQELDMQQLYPASWEQMDERFLTSMEASMHRLLATCKKCRDGSLSATTHSVQLPHAERLNATVCKILDTHTSAATTDAVCFTGADVYLDARADAAHSLHGVDQILDLLGVGMELGHAATCNDTMLKVPGPQVLSEFASTAQTPRLGDLRKSADLQKSIHEGRQSQFKARLAMHHLYHVSKSFTRALLDASDSDVASRMLAALVTHALDAYRDLLAALRAAIAQWSMAHWQLQPFLILGAAPCQDTVTALDVGIQAELARLQMSETGVADLVHRLRSHAVPSGLHYLTQSDMALRFGAAAQAASATSMDQSGDVTSELRGDDLLEDGATPADTVSEMSGTHETVVVGHLEVQPLLTIGNDEATSDCEEPSPASSVTVTVVTETTLSEDASERKASAGMLANDYDVSEPAPLPASLRETHEDFETRNEPGATAGESNNQVSAMEQSPGTVDVAYDSSAASNKSLTSTAPEYVEFDDDLEYEIITDEEYFFEATPPMALDAPHWLNIHYC